MIIDLNFPLVRHLVKNLDDNIMLSRTIKLLDDDIDNEERS